MNPENDIPKTENCSRIIREFLKDYSRSPTRIRLKWLCIPKFVYWNPIIRLSNCKIVQRTRKSKMKHTTPTTVLFFNLTGFDVTISVTSIATNVNGCGIGVMGNTLTMDMDKTENKIQTVRVYPYAFKDDDTRDYFSSDNSMMNSNTEREKIRELLKDQKDIFWTSEKDLEAKIVMRTISDDPDEKEIRKNPLGYLSAYITNQEYIKNKMKEDIQNKKLKIGTINRNLRLSSAMIDPCSHRYYLTIRIHDTDEGRLIMTDNIHRTNYDIIIRHEDIKRPSKKTETAP